MADLLWDDHIAWLLDPTDGGCLPDAYVEGTTVADWQTLLDLVEEQGWSYEYTEGDAVLPLPRAEAVLSRPADAECPSLSVWPDPGVCAIFRFLGHEQIDFDVDLRELQGQERMDVLCGFLSAIGRRLDKSVRLFPEGGHGFTQPLLGFDVAADRVRVLWEPPGGQTSCPTAARRESESRSTVTEWRVLICDETPQDIVLLDVGPRPLEVAKALRNLSGIGLWHAKQAVTQPPPVRLAEGVGDDVTAKWVGPLRDAGAVVELQTWWRYRPGQGPLPLS